MKINQRDKLNLVILAILFLCSGAIIMAFLSFGIFFFISLWENAVEESQRKYSEWERMKLKKSLENVSS